MTRPTPATFREDLIKAIAIKAGFQADEPVPMKEVLPHVYQLSGIGELDYGTDKGGNGWPQVRLWVQQCHKALIRKGEATKVGRGQWALSDKGVAIAKTLSPEEASSVASEAPVAPPAEASDLSIDDILDSLDAEPVAPSVEPTVAPPAPTPTVAPKAPTTPSLDGGEGVSWSLGERVNRYNPDPYIRGIAVSSTPCFGQFSARSKVCGTCPLSGACKDALAAEVSAIAARFRLEASKPADSVPSVDDSLDAILNAIEDDTAPQSEPTPTVEKDDSDYSIIVAPHEAKCRKCSGVIQKDEKAVFIRGTGLLHTHCHTK